MQAAPRAGLLCQHAGCQRPAVLFAADFSPPGPRGANRRRKISRVDAHSMTVCFCVVFFVTIATLRVPPPASRSIPLSRRLKDGPSVAPAARPPIERAEPADAAAQGPEPAAAPHGRRAGAGARVARRARPERVPEEGRGVPPEQTSQPPPRERGGRPRDPQMLRGSRGSRLACSAVPEPPRRGLGRADGAAANVARARRGDGPDPDPERGRGQTRARLRRRRRPRAERKVRTRHVRRETRVRRPDDVCAMRSAIVPEWRVLRRRTLRRRRAEPERGRLARFGAARQRRERRERRRAGGDGGPRVRARRRRGRVRLRDRTRLVTTRCVRARVRGRSDVFRVFRV